MKTLLHICCAPCANQCIDVLRTDGYELTGFWYNPNIHPFTEYRSRRNCLREYAKTVELPLLERDEYALRPFVRAVAEDISGRCVKCYEMRLFAAAQMAQEGGFDSFTSSLFISPYPSVPPQSMAWRFSTAISVLISAPDRSARGSWACTFRNTAAASFPRRSATASQTRLSDNIKAAGGFQPPFCINIRIFSALPAGKSGR